MRFRIGWKQQPAVPVPTWFATIHVARQPQIACLPLIYLYIYSLLSLVYIDQNAIIECRVCVLDRDQPESDTLLSPCTKPISDSRLQIEPFTAFCVLLAFTGYLLS